MANNNKKPPMGGMGPGRGPGAVEKPKNFKETTKKRIKLYLVDYKWRLLLLEVLSL